MSARVPLTLDYSYLAPDVTAEQVGWQQEAVNVAHRLVETRKGQGAEMLGWLDPATMLVDQEPDGEPFDSYETLKATAETLRTNSEIMVVVGIGGSYLGARTAIEALGADAGHQVWYAGHTLSADYLSHLLKSLKGKKYCINVISKSGNTTETAVAFRLLREAMAQEFGDDAKQRIIATTSASRGTIIKIAKSQGYPVFYLPESIGGRYSVLSAVGLLPIAFAGIDIDALRAGAIDCAAACKTANLKKNPAYTYAVVRNMLYRKGKSIELLATFEPRLHFLAEWWKQLYGESEGKEHMSLFPASVEFTTDLHSMGQWIQEGRRDLFETFVTIAEGQAELAIPNDPQGADGFDFLNGRTVNEVNVSAYQGTALAHWEGKVPNMTITMARLDAYNLGALFYFFEKACAISGYLLGVNPFNQPGVEAYKNNMFALLGKQGTDAASVKKAIADHTGKQVVTF
jgi:glucose-6-phosphate isomerase